MQPATAAGGHSLDGDWAFWQDAWCARDDAAVGGVVHQLQRVGTFRTIKEFWALFNDLPLSKVVPGSSLHLMRCGVEPIAEDPAHGGGGRFRVSCPTATTGCKVWLDLCLAVLGSQFPQNTAARVTGISYTLRRADAHHASIWLSRKGDEKEVVNAYLKKLAPTLPLVWTNHADCLSRNVRAVTRECDDDASGRRRRSHSAPTATISDDAATSLRDTKLLSMSQRQFKAARAGEAADPPAKATGSPSAAPVSVLRDPAGSKGKAAGGAEKRVNITVTEPAGTSAPVKSMSAEARRRAKQVGHRRRHTDGQKENFIPSEPLLPPGGVGAAEPAPSAQMQSPMLTTAFLRNGADAPASPTADRTPPGVPAMLPPTALFPIGSIQPGGSGASSAVSSTVNSRGPSPPPLGAALSDVTTSPLVESAGDPTLNGGGAAPALQYHPYAQNLPPSAYMVHSATLNAPPQYITPSPTHTPALTVPASSPLGHSIYSPTESSGGSPSMPPLGPASPQQPSQALYSMFVPPVPGAAYNALQPVLLPPAALSPLSPPQPQQPLPKPRKQKASPPDAAAASPAAAPRTPPPVGGGAGGNANPAPHARVGHTTPPAFVHKQRLYPQGLTRKQRRAIIYSHEEAKAIGCPEGAVIPFDQPDGTLTAQGEEDLCRRLGLRYPQPASPAPEKKPAAVPAGAGEP
eukprot:TRINITY_DN16636_c0_g1_i1.p1 TRINITY_DN16636_c0_g1~~TRINITY_DN16636_c0_g1_i1.p1  ORF type:complete len:717 (+),score=209.50 TRINITY_DN16636_c0_g1_i1:89-2152(+)